MIEAFDNNRALYFSSSWAAAKLNLPLGYVQRLLSRLRKRGLLGRIQVPRLLAAGYHGSGIANLYFLTQRGRDRANWFKRANSLVGFQYLATGTGAPGEVQKYFLTNFMVDTLTRSSLLFKSYAQDSSDTLLTVLTKNLACQFSMPAMPMSVEVLRKQGLIPEGITPLFPFLAKVGYRCSNTQILLALLYRSAEYWKNKSEHLERQNTFLKFELVIKGLLDRLKELTYVEPTKQDNLTLEIQKAFLTLTNSDLTYTNSELSREVRKLRWHVLVSDAGMQLVCSTLTDIGDHSPAVKYTKRMLTHLQIMNFGV